MRVDRTRNAQNPNTAAAPITCSQGLSPTLGRADTDATRSGCATETDHDVGLGIWFERMPGPIIWRGSAEEAAAEVKCAGQQEEHPQ